jgi:hypothetical protein
MNFKATIFRWNWFIYSNFSHVRSQRLKIDIEYILHICSIREETKPKIRKKYKVQDIYEVKWQIVKQICGRVTGSKLN